MNENCIAIVIVFIASAVIAGAGGYLIGLKVPSRFGSWALFAWTIFITVVSVSVVEGLL